MHTLASRSPQIAFKSWRGIKGEVCNAVFFYFFNFAKLSIFTLVVSNAFAFEYILALLLLYEAYAFLRKLT